MLLSQEFASSFGRLTANHLWQSTAFAAVAVLLALALRGNHARARYWLWLAASVKFLVPFSVLVAIGGSLGRWFVPAMTVSRVPFVMEQIVQPFAPIQNTFVPVAASASVATTGPLTAVLLALWLCGFLAVLLYAWTRWHHVAAAVRLSTPLTEGRELEAWGRLAFRPSGIRLVSSTAKLEPGVFGIFRPVLWLPPGIGNRLEDAELEAILAHELCHIRRHDNLLATLHLLVESIFWFHPLVWWLGARLEEERERACDEEVVRLGGEPQIYAESILKVCEFYLASPVACAAGVTGGELKKRIEGIMTNRFTRKLNFGKKMLLTAAAVVAVAVPIVVGLMNPARGRAQAQSTEFEVASVKPAPPDAYGAMRGGPGTEDPGRITYPRVTLRTLLAEAYDVRQDQIQGPGWMSTENYSVAAAIPPHSSRTEFEQMLQNLLSERFHLTLHHETKDFPIYDLLVANGGPRLQLAQPDPEGVTPLLPGSLPRPPNDRNGYPVLPPGARGAANNSDGMVLWTQRMTMPELCEELSIVINTALDDVRGTRPFVLDKTGLPGRYEFHLAWALPLSYLPPDATPGGDTLFAALEKRLGLKLVKAKDAPMDLLVIDQAEKVPTEN
jgi:uncharacterized protein (TIGR03435 family)